MIETCMAATGWSVSTLGTRRNMALRRALSDGLLLPPGGNITGARLQRGADDRAISASVSGGSRSTSANCGAFSRRTSGECSLANRYVHLAGRKRPVLGGIGRAITFRAIGTCESRLPY
jgi:hypothetical protein